jgi:hypothetical protein
MIVNVKSRTDNAIWEVAGDALDSVVAVPPFLPTNVQITASDIQPFWISWTGLADPLAWEKVKAMSPVMIMIPAGALNLYIRKPYSPMPSDTSISINSYTVGDRKNRMIDSQIRLNIEWIK